MDITTFAKTNEFIHFTTYAMIVAVDASGGIGINNTLPWPKCKEDMQWFRKQTLGKIIVMGRSTFESIGGKPLPGRINIVISRTLDPAVAREINTANAENKDAGYLLFVNSPDKAKEVIQQTAGTLHKGGEVMVIGGATIYEAFWPSISRLYLTTFGDTYNTDVGLEMDLTGFDKVYMDATGFMQPKFEIYDVRPSLIVNRKDNKRFA
ncbi:dihydrofolate reductase [Serratia phage vB_SmaM-Sureiya]|nr:dihydrofolate reductase [Serratia phage vB_SmaM-Sureiya]